MNIIMSTSEDSFGWYVSAVRIDPDNGMGVAIMRELEGKRYKTQEDATEAFKQALSNVLTPML